MKDIIMNNIISDMGKYINNYQLEKLKQVINHYFYSIEVVNESNNIKEINLDYNNLTFYKNDDLKAEYGANNMQVDNATINQTMDLCGLTYTKIDDDNIIVD